MSLLQSLFADKKESTRLHNAFTMGMELARQHLWETALHHFLSAVDLPNSYNQIAGHALSVLQPPGG